MKLIKSIIEMFLALATIYGFLCVVSEADPWTATAQILLFIKGVVIIAVSVGIMCFIERGEDVNDFISR